MIDLNNSKHKQIECDRQHPEKISFAGILRMFPSDALAVWRRWFKENEIDVELIDLNKVDYSCIIKSMNKELIQISLLDSPDILISQLAKIREMYTTLLSKRDNSWWKNHIYKKSYSEKRKKNNASIFLFCF